MDLICSLNLVSRTLKRFVIEVTAPHRDITEDFSFLTLQLNFCIIYCEVISTANALSSECLQCGWMRWAAVTKQSQREYRSQHCLNTLGFSFAKEWLGKAL